MKLSLFYTPVCPRCPEAKVLNREVLVKFPEVEYEEVNAFEHQDEVKALGFSSVPAYVIDGEVWMTGIPGKRELVKVLKKGLKGRK